MARLLIVKTGDAFPEVVRDYGDFETLFIAAVGDIPDLQVSVFDGRRKALPELNGIDGLTITGSHAMVSDGEPWSEALMPWLRDARQRDIAMLGVCYGHQLMAAAFGGEAGYHPAGRETGTHEVRLTDAGLADPLLGTLPPVFPAQLTHAQSVLEPPPDAILLASNYHDRFQALRYGPRQWSVQFHPEFTPAVMRAYLERQREELAGLGQDPNARIAAVTATPEAGSLLRSFAARLAEEH